MIVSRRDPFPSSVHIVGVGGSGTSGLAHILRSRGVHVTGSDRTSESVLSLRNAGIEVEIGHRPENLVERTRMVVHSAAVPDSNPELVESRRRGLEVIKYAQCLGRLLDDSFGIAVAGTHGKTSTGAMLTSVWLAADRDPTVLLGGHHPDLSGNWRAGRGGEFLVEACEFDRSFLALHPRAAIITNLELDHPDIYPDLDAVQDSFASFLAGIPAGGLAVIGIDGEGARSLPVPRSCRAVTFGLRAEADWHAAIREGGERPIFEAYRSGRSWGRFRLGVAGKHNVVNALGVIALAEALDVPRDAIAEGLERFPGVERRFQKRGRVAEVDWVDDFAHHPTEIATAIDTAREVFGGRRVCVVFQPHQFGRLRTFAEGFAEELARADAVALFPVYSVREELDLEGESLLDALVMAVRRRGTPVERYRSFDDAERRLPSFLRPDDVAVACGAGNLCTFTDRMVARAAEGAR